MRFWHGADYNYEQWLDRPEVLDQDFEGMARVRANVVAVGIFSWAKYEPREGQFEFGWMDGLLDRLHDHGMKAILATPSGSKPAWLSRAYPEVCPMDIQGHREPHGYRHNHCRSSPVYRSKCLELNTLLARRYADHPALALWHVSNEYGAGRCYCPGCLSAFRGWLKHRYGDLDALNRAWWTDFWSHRFGDWDEIVPTDSSLNGMMLDWARFVSDQTVDFFEAEARPLREITPEVPVTTNFHGPDVGLDYFAFARHVDIVSWDSYPRWHSEDDTSIALKTAFVHDLFRSSKGKPFLLMESTPSNTNWQGVSALKRPGYHLLASLHAVAHGADSVQYFQWRQSRGGEEKFHGAVITHLGSLDTRTFHDVEAVGAALGKLDDLAGTPVRSEAAVIYDFANAWAIELAHLPRSLEKRYREECLAPYAALSAQGIGVDVIGAKGFDLSSYRLVVVPMLYLLEEETVEALKAFVARGGTLVVTYLSGVVDRSDLCFEGGAPGPLADLLGLRVEETDALPDVRPQTVVYRGQSFGVRHYADLLRPTTAEILGVYGSDFYAGTPAVTVNRWGSGAAWYVAARTKADFWRTFLDDRCREAGVHPAVPWPIPSGVGVRRRGAACFVFNFTTEPVTLQLGTARYRDLLSGDTLEGSHVLPGAAVRVLV